MKQTNKKKILKNNKTKKSNNFKRYIPFEKDYSKTLSKTDLKISNKKVIKNFIKNLELRDKPKILPEDDFYTYVNYTWLEGRSFDAIELKKEQKYITEVDNFRLIQDKVAKEISELLYDYSKKNNTEESKRLKNFLSSAKTRNSINKSKIYVNYIINKINELRSDKNNLWKMLAMVNKLTFSKEQAPFYWNINHNLKNNTKFMAYLNPHILPILDSSVYDLENEQNIKYKNNVKKNFYNYCSDLFNTTLGKNHNLDLNGPFLITKKFYDFMNCNNKNIIENPVGFNILTPKEALEKYNFNWEEFCKELGYKKIPSEFCCTSLNYLKCCSEFLIENWNSEEMKSYWYWLFLRQIARFTDKWIYVFYNYYGKLLKGEQVLYPEYDLNLIYAGFAFNKLARKLYIDKYYDAEKINFIKGLAEDLREVFIRIIKRNTWLDNSTKKSAILKLEKLNFILVQSDNVIDDPIIDYDPNDFLGNMIKISEWQCNMFIKLTNKDYIDIPQLYWTDFPAKFISKQAYAVNAYYIPQQNSMFIPLAYMQKPFIDLDNRGIEYNLSQIGFTIAHELSHSLDTTGSQYDYKGNLNNWWTEKDKLKYEKIQENILKEYYEWFERDGLDYNPSIGIEEDIADISGLAICEEYLRDKQLIDKSILKIREISFIAFYIYFAYQNRQKINKKDLLIELRSNPHPLVKYRTNIPLSRSDLFNTVYQIKKGDGMYWPDRSTIW